MTNILIIASIFITEYMPDAVVCNLYVFSLLIIIIVYRMNFQKTENDAQAGDGSLL